ncbi:hypothetical protein [Mycolicibacterium sphagni]|uniref:Uncharacterized protein n=1 Tax=Mycolicibacterium sphagni TaxID=1786 RepID=A0A255DE64_9MYCO|nr:hypothetical protein [Mycolicibacterium sphagni]MCV7177329.1 hypothetical protein [Mycolicibacterium sphagni]OYN77708.1 hypothetical protein CG716_17645 [Mycolicibacterium sphagni]
MSHLTSRSAADSDQAQHFRCILAERRAELDARLAEDAQRLAARHRSGSTCGVKSIRYRIRKMERQRSELDRLLDGLAVLADAVSS